MSDEIPDGWVAVVYHRRRDRAAVYMRSGDDWIARDYKGRDIVNPADGGVSFPTAAAAIAALEKEDKA